MFADAFLEGIFRLHSLGTSLLRFLVCAGLLRASVPKEDS